MLLLVILLVLLMAFVAYIGYVIHIKAINPKEIRVKSVHDAKKLLTLPSNAGTQRYLAKRA
ncbi:uncharacterized protein LOC117783243 [Drosophila innubila]|uniref:uncharacterized protein LOC117783243 n=1 Tax=Drosophila innubila TaxID=198719 RepID=UPI00148B4EC7|nr:uncharacterized protein LOC117783243 [Drosophila innubila]